MGEPSKASQSAGSGQSHQRPVHHSRPFFYVQPHLQPFYTYQWHMNNPYSQSIHGSGFHFGRSCMMPYSYLQYPGYVVPHAAMHPMDYRRIYERTFPPPTPSAAYDFSVRQPTSPERETTCVGAQTDPCEALNKLIECLDQLRAGEELHCRVDSHTSGAPSPLNEKEKSEEETEACAGKTLSCFNTAHKETACCGVECLNKQEEWPVKTGKKPLLDNSCDQEEDFEAQEENNFLHQGFSVNSQSHSKDKEVQGKNHDQMFPDRKGPETNEGMDWGISNADWPASQSSPVRPASARTTESQCTESALNHPGDISGNYSCCILHLPFEKVLKTGVHAPGSTTQSLGSPFKYGYCPPQLSHERVSVLSPSLDELSSHDELLSTDLEDMGLFPPRIYTRGKLAEFTLRKGHPSIGKIHADMCVVYPKRLTCAVCGSNSFKECSRPKDIHCETSCYGHVDDSDEEAIETKSGHWEAGKMCKHGLQGTMTKIYTKKTHPHLKHRAKHREKFELEARQGQTEAFCTEHFYCEKCTSSPEKSSVHSARGINTRPFKERQCRTFTSDQVPWENAGDNTKPKICRAQLLLKKKEKIGKKKSHPQGSRYDSIAAEDGDDDDDEEDEGEEECKEILQIHRGKGTTKRGGVRS